jgi:hypothetical protein
MSNPQEQPQDPVEAWKAQWPNHCKACGGWGAWQYAEPSGELTIERCTALPEGTCHRCGTLDAIDPEDEMHPQCRECGWNFDDGVPEPDDQDPIEE